MYQPVSLGQLHLLPPHTAVRVLGQLAQPGQLAPRQQVLRSVTGEAELLGALGAYPPQTRVELWGQLLSAAPNRLMIHGMRPLEAQVPTGPALLRATNGPFQGVVRAMHYGRTLLGQDTSQRVYRLEWCCPDSPELHWNRASRWSGDRQEGMFQVQGEVHTQAYGVATLRVLRAWPLDGACA